VTLHGKDLRDDRTVETGELVGLVGKMTMVGEFQANGHQTELINGEVVLQEEEGLGEVDQTCIENEVILRMSGRRHGAVVDLIMTTKMSGGAHQMSGFLNGAMMILTILTHLALLIHQEHLCYTSKKRKEKEVKMKETLKNKKKLWIDIKEVNQKVIHHKTKIQMCAKKMTKTTIYFLIQVQKVLTMEDPQKHQKQ